MSKHPDDAGFTLIETLVALAVFAILAAGTTALIGESVRTKDVVTAATDRQAGLALARAILKDDLLSATPRPARDILGSTKPISFTGGSLDPDAPLLSLVRRGRVNPGLGEDRTSLLYVEYRLEGGRLIRRTRDRLDGTAKTPTTDRILMEGLTKATFEYLGTSGWVERWQAGDMGTGGLPIAAALVTESPATGPLRQLFLISGEVRR